MEYFKKIQTVLQIYQLYSVVRAEGRVTSIDCDFQIVRGDLVGSSVQAEDPES